MIAFPFFVTLHTAIQAALDSAGTDASGGTVILPKGVFITTQPLIIPGGVTLQGQGYGSSPLAIQFDAGGSTIAYCGTDHAVKILASSSTLKDLAVYDWPYNHGPHDAGCPDIQAAGGVIHHQTYGCNIASIMVHGLSTESWDCAKVHRQGPDYVGDQQRFGQACGISRLGDRCWVGTGR